MTEPKSHTYLCQNQTCKWKSDQTSNDVSDCPQCGGFVLAIFPDQASAEEHSTKMTPNLDSEQKPLVQYLCETANNCGWKSEPTRDDVRVCPECGSRELEMEYPFESIKSTRAQFTFIAQLHGVNLYMEGDDPDEKQLVMDELAAAFSAKHHTKKPMEFKPCAGCMQKQMWVIRAAPDMLVVLKNLENDAGQIPAHVWEMRNRAIAKANGDWAEQTPETVLDDLKEGVEHHKSNWDSPATTPLEDVENLKESAKRNTFPSTLQSIKRHALYKMIQTDCRSDNVHEVLSDAVSIDLISFYEIGFISKDKIQFACVIPADPSNGKDAIELELDFTFMGSR